MVHHIPEDEMVHQPPLLYGVNRASWSLRELANAYEAEHGESISMSMISEYFQTHRDHLHYQQVAKQGGPIGSGSVESLCSQFQDRFKRTGQFWSRPGFGHLISLDVLLRNQDYDFLWN